MQGLVGDRICVGGGLTVKTDSCGARSESYRGSVTDWRDPPVRGCGKIKGVSFIPQSRGIEPATARAVRIDALATGLIG